MTRRTLIGSLVGSAAAVAVAGCAPTTGGAAAATVLTSEATLKELPAGTAAVTNIGDALRAFAWELIREGDGNRLVSPSSFGLALGMVGEGATGGSAAAIDDVFGVGGAERSAALGGWKQSLKPYDTLPEKVDVEEPPETPVVHLGAQVVAVGDVDVKQEFLDQLAAYYAASASHVDSWRDLKPVLDEFARQHTAGLIEESGIEPNEDIRLVLQDALLFAAGWRQEFKSESTMQFHAAGGPKDVDSLNGRFACVAIETADVRAIRMPFIERFVMDVILPTDDVAAFTSEMLQQATEDLNHAVGSEVSATVEMPASSQTGKLFLVEPLQALGIVPGTYDDIFAEAAIDQFVQQTKLIVGAKGAVGAALTEVAMVEVSGVPVVEFEFIVDRPYILQIQDTEEGWPLFLSVITDPSEE